MVTRPHTYGVEPRCAHCLGGSCIGTNFAPADAYCQQGNAGVPETIEVPDIPHEKRELIEAISAAPTARAMRTILEQKLRELDARGVEGGGDV